ncbi:class I SAM-dependent methyltransferase [Candidatus Woesearchaeota archaeon]|nr:class I SAM-dependent methyltransferase [Candidatus Woesearchaeota archaeon]
MFVEIIGHYMSFDEQTYWNERIRTYGMKSTGSRHPILYEYSDTLKWKIFKRTLTTLPLKPLDKINILDVGCGYGRWSLQLSKEGYRVVGVDVSDESIKNARKEAEKQGVAVTFLQMPAQSIKFDQKFDLAISITVLQHVMNDEQWEKTFQNIYDLLKPGGFFFLIESAPTFTKKQKLVYKAERTFKEHKKAAKRAGFSLIKQSSTLLLGYYIFWGMESIFPRKLQEKLGPKIMRLAGNVDYFFSQFGFLVWLADHKMILLKKNEN